MNLNNQDIEEIFKMCKLYHLDFGGHERNYAYVNVCVCVCVYVCMGGECVRQWDCAGE